MAKRDETKNLPAEKQKYDMMDPSAFADDAGTGFEDTSQADYAIPFLSILQALSAQCTMGDPKYDEDLRPGMFFNSVTEEAFSGKTGILFVPCMYQRQGNIWVPKSQGGGFRGVVELAHLEAELARCQRDETNGDMVIEDGNVLVDTRNWFGLVLSDNGPDPKITPVLLALSKTQLKKSKRWLTLAQGIRYNGQPMPLFSQVYHLTTVPESNDKGSWMGLELKHVGTVASMKIYEEAKMFRELVTSGKAKIAEPAADTSFDPDKF